MTLDRSHIDTLLHDALIAARSTAPAHPRSYWYHQPQQNFPPPPIQSPDQYTGGDRLSVVCTQTTLPPKAQKALVRRWCATLPTLSGVRTLWFHSRVTQELFDAACAVPGLQGLYVKWSGIESLAALSAATSLHALRLGSSPGIGSIACLSRLTGLRWLELDNLKRITDLTPLGALVQLEGLAFTGGEGTRNTVASLAPLADLRELSWLHLGALHVADGSLRPLGGLERLRQFHAGMNFPWTEFAWLAGKLPACWGTRLRAAEDLGHIGFQCKRCSGGLLMPSGKGLRNLCPACDAKKWTSFAVGFAAAVAQARE